MIALPHLLLAMRMILLEYESIVSDIDPPVSDHGHDAHQFGLVESGFNLENALLTFMEGSFR
jgi:hypothetical protein